MVPHYVKLTLSVFSNSMCHWAVSELLRTEKPHFSQDSDHTSSQVFFGGNLYLYLSIFF